MSDFEPILTEAEKKELLLNPKWHSHYSAQFVVTPKMDILNAIQEKAKAAMQKEEDENIFSSIIGKMDVAKTLAQLYKEDFLYGEAFPFIDPSAPSSKTFINPAQVTVKDLHVEFEAKKARMYYPGDGSRWADL